MELLDIKFKIILIYLMVFLKGIDNISKERWFYGFKKEFYGEVSVVACCLGLYVLF